MEKKRYKLNLFFKGVMLSALLAGNVWSTFAQNTVAIPDANLRQYLMTVHPSMMNASQQLDTLMTAAFTGTINCRSRNIADFNGIQYFKGAYKLLLDSNNAVTLPEFRGFNNLVEFGCKNNQLTSLPSLSGMINLELLTVSNNQITALPDLTANTKLRKIYSNDNLLTTIPDLSSLTVLEGLFLRNNRLISLPDLSNSEGLKEISLLNNNLTSLPDLSFIGGQLTLNISQNHLTFEDMLPLSSIDGFPEDFDLEPQKKFGTYADEPLVPGNAFVFNLGVDASVTSNIYEWYKDGELLTTTTNNTLTIDPLSFSDAGTYHAVIKNTNPEFSGIALTSTPKRLTIQECMDVKDLTFTISDYACNEPATVAIEENSLSGGTPPYNFSLVRKQTGDQITFTQNAVQTREGNYDLIVEDNEGCSLYLHNFIVVPPSLHCDPVFSPNGDGINDSYFIATPGHARVYNKAGKLVKELYTPAFWDGTDQDGQFVKAGYYAIVVNGVTAMNVSVMK